jgi:integrase
MCCHHVATADQRTFRKMKTVLTDRGIKALKPRARAYDLADAVVPGLGVRVLPSGVKSFVLVARYPGSKNPTRRSLGGYGALKLEDARTKARQWLDLLARGIDPAAEVERTRIEADRRRRDTVAAIIESYIKQEVIGPDPVKPRHRNHRKTLNGLRDVLIPAFGDRPIADLHQRDVMPLIEAIGAVGTDRALVKFGVRKKLRRPTRAGKPSPVQARAIFGLLDGVCRWAADHGGFGIETSPLMMIKKSRRFGPLTRRERVLSDDELVALWRAIGRVHTPYQEVYRLLLLGGLRLNEVARARWDEIDAKAKLWTIPAARMKGRNDGTAREHVVPLTPGMLTIVASLPRGNRGPFIFSVKGGKSPVTFNGDHKADLNGEMLHELRVIAKARGESGKVALVPWRNHDLRRTMRTALSRLGVAPDVAEAVIAHAIPGVRGTYDRYDRLEEKRVALERWAGFVASLVDPRPAVNVVRINKRRATRL